MARVEIDLLEAANEVAKELRPDIYKNEGQTKEQAIEVLLLRQKILTALNRSIHAITSKT